MVFQLDGLMWLLLWLGPLLLLQRKVHFEIQAIMLFLTRRTDMVTVLFSMFFLPGVLLHEFSHFLTARLVGVQTGKFSVLPRNLGNGKLQLGYVETATLDMFRDSLIGAAPLLVGGVLILYIARVQLGLRDFIIPPGTLGVGIAMDLTSYLLRAPDFWLWFYLLFTISSTMLPSASDRRAWMPLTGIVVMIGIVGVILGIGPWMLSNLVPTLNSSLRIVAFVFGISALVHLVLLLPLFFTRKILGKMTGLDIRG